MPWNGNYKKIFWFLCKGHDV